MKLKPVIKYAGGKKQIMDILLKEFPTEFNNYHEPFLGGGSVVFELYNRNLLKDKKIFLSDIMTSLMNMYNQIKNNKDDLLEELSDKKYENKLEIFLESRKQFNILKLHSKSELSSYENIKLASLFIYLNKTCFNGLYRENKKGEYNVPFGKQKNPTICNKSGIENLNKFFIENDVNLNCYNYTYIEENIKPGDFIYMDPPYHNTFTDYSKNKFGEEEQKELKEFVDKLTKKGCKVCVSNSNTEFITNLWSDYKIVKIPVKRLINSKSEGRKEIHYEVLIKNF